VAAVEVVTWQRMARESPTQATVRWFSTMQTATAVVPEWRSISAASHFCSQCSFHT
jgi:hypothetical protein